MNVLSLGAKYFFSWGLTRLIKFFSSLILVVWMAYNNLRPVFLYHWAFWARASNSKWPRGPRPARWEPMKMFTLDIPMRLDQKWPIRSNFVRSHACRSESAKFGGGNSIWYLDSNSKSVLGWAALYHFSLAYLFTCSVTLFISVFCLYFLLQTIVSDDWDFFLPRSCDNKLRSQVPQARTSLIKFQSARNLPQQFSNSFFGLIFFKSISSLGDRARSIKLRVKKIAAASSDFLSNYMLLLLVRFFKTRKKWMK